MLEINLESETSLQQIESYAMAKLVDLQQIKPFSHITEGKKFLDIIREGLISIDLAKRIKKKNFQSKGVRWNYRNVSLLPTPVYRVGIGSVRFIINPSVTFEWVEERWFPGVEFSASFPHTEALAHLRVSPRELIGLTLPSFKAIGTDSQSDLIDNLLFVAVPVWKGRPEVSLPFYDGETLDLVWPKRISHSEIVEMLVERQK